MHRPPPSQLPALISITCALVHINIEIYWSIERGRGTAKGARLGMQNEARPQSILGVPGGRLRRLHGDGRAVATTTAAA